jgi:catechol 2,3-dioxygenase-like lactoylglutathione lyase family enzyme
MLDHVSIGVRDIARARRFYDSVLAPLGFSCMSDFGEMIGYGRQTVALWISVVERPVPADEKSGLHFCFAAPTRASVDAFHKAALKAGGRDNGKPGLRDAYGPNYYAAFVIDPDGYRLEAYCGAPAKSRHSGRVSTNARNVICLVGPTMPSTRWPEMMPESDHCMAPRIVVLAGLLDPLTVSRRHPLQASDRKRFTHGQNLK